VRESERAEQEQKEHTRRIGREHKQTPVVPVGESAHERAEDNRRKSRKPHYQSEPHLAVRPGFAQNQPGQSHGKKFITHCGNDPAGEKFPEIRKNSQRMSHIPPKKKKRLKTETGVIKRIIIFQYDIIFLEKHTSGTEERTGQLLKPTEILMSVKSGYLKRVLTESVSSGIITPGQAGRIMERANRGKNRLGVHVLASLAGLSAALGVISLIAHNWNLINPHLKIAVFLFLYLLTGTAYIMSGERKIIKNISEKLWFFMPAAGIGLYSQIYNLYGDPAGALLLWTVLSAPVAWLSSDKIILWLFSILSCSLLFFGFSPDSFLCLNRPDGFLYSLTVLAICTFYNYRKGHTGSLALALPLCWLFFTLACRISPINISRAPDSPTFLSLLSFSLTGIWFMYGPGKNRSFLSPPFFAFLLLSFFFTFYSSPAIKAGQEFFSTAGLVLTGLLVSLSALSLTVIKRNFANAPRFMFLASLAAVCLTFRGPAADTAVRIIFNIIILAAGAYTIFEGAGKKETAMINTGFCTVLVLLLTRFFGIFRYIFAKRYTLLSSAEMLLLFSCILGVIAYALHRTEACRKNLIKKAAEK